MPNIFGYDFDYGAGNDATAGNGQAAEGAQQAAIQIPIQQHQQFQNEVHGAGVYLHGLTGITFVPTPPVPLGHQVYNAIAALNGILIKEVIIPEIQFNHLKEFLNLIQHHPREPILIEGGFNGIIRVRNENAVLNLDMFLEDAPE